MDERSEAIEHQKKLWGKDVVNRASANLERQMKADFVTLVDEKTGTEKQYKKPVADILLAKRNKAHSKPRSVFTVPDFGDIDWSK